MTFPAVNQPVVDLAFHENYNNNNYSLYSSSLMAIYNARSIGSERDQCMAFYKTNDAN